MPAEVTKLRFKDGDGEEDGEAIASIITITTVDNGWVVIVSDDVNGTESTMVFPFDHGKEMLAILSEELGI